MLNANNKPTYANAIRNVSAVLLNGVAGTLGVNTNSILIATAGVNGSLVRTLTASTNESADRHYFIFILDANNVVIPLNYITVPAGSGNSLAVFDVLGALVGLNVDNQLKPYLQLQIGDRLKAVVSANMTADKSIWFTGLIRDYE